MNSGSSSGEWDLSGSKSDLNNYIEGKIVLTSDLNLNCSEKIQAQ